MTKRLWRPWGLGTAFAGDHVDQVFGFAAFLFHVPVRKRGYASQRDNVSPIDVIARKRFVTNPVSVLFRDDGEREDIHATPCRE
jgi:hypothetical protein